MSAALKVAPRLQVVEGMPADVGEQPKAPSAVREIDAQEIPFVMSPAQFSELMDVGRNLPYDLIREGRLHAVRCGNRWRIPRSSVIAYLSGDDKRAA